MRLGQPTPLILRTQRTQQLSIRDQLKEQKNAVEKTEKEIAEKSLEALKKLSSPTSIVIRNSKTQTIDSTDLVPGDIIELEAGNFVPADCRLIDAYNLKVEESALTGETVPVIKEAKTTLSKNVPLGYMINMAFSTTIVTNGHAKAVVTETGMNTKVGKIAKMIILKMI